MPLSLCLRLVPALCLASLRIAAQEPLHFRHIDSRQGLSQNSVFAIAQDGDGFMWFGTRKGLNRYDGYRMRTYEPGTDAEQGLAHEDIRALSYDAAIDRLWVCTSRGLSQYRPDLDQFCTYSFPAARDAAGPYEPVHCVLRDRAGHLWVGTGGGLYRYRADEDRFVRCHQPQPFDVQTLFEDREGVIWAGGDKGLYLMVPDTLGQPVYRPRPAAGAAVFGAAVTEIAQDPAGRYWIAGQAGLYSWLPGSPPRHYRHDPQDPYSISHDHVRTIRIDARGRVWVGTFVGLNVYDPATERFHRYFQVAGDPRSLANNSVRSICFDARGSAWIGTYYGGISYYHPDSYRFTHHQPREDGLSHAVVSAFWEDAAGNLWVGTEGGGLNYWDRSTGRYQHYRHEPGQATGISGNNVKVIYGRGDSLWIGTFATGLNLLHLGTRRWQHIRAGGPEGLGNDNVYDLLQIGRQLWIATYGDGIGVMDLGGGTMQAFRHHPHDSLSISSSLVRVLLRDRQGRLWVGTNGGLDQIEGRLPGALRFRHVLRQVMVCSLLEGRDGTLWVGTYDQGLYALDTSGRVLNHFTRDDGLSGPTVFGLLEDPRGRIWISSDRGLARVDVRDASISVYNYSDGLDNLEYNFNAYYQVQSGEMFFGGTQGFTSFFPNDIRTNTFVPPLVFTHLSSANRHVRPGEENGLLRVSIDETRRLVFPYNRANFAIGFSALDYLNPANNHYAYLLEGLDQDWQRVQGQTEVSYTLQRSGDYRFRLRGGNNDGIWNQQERTIEITVLPPPWRSLLAYGAYALLLSLLLLGAYGLIRIRHRLQLEQFAKAQQEALHQAKLRFYTNVTHEFRTPLTLILGPVEELLRKGGSGGERQLQAIRQNAGRLLRLVNQLLDFRSLEQDHSQLQVAPGDIVSFLREVHLSFQEQARMAQIRYEFVSGEAQIELWFDRDKLEKVFYNLLSNAFKFTPDGGGISVQVRAAAAEVQVRVCDSGPGIPEVLRERVFERFFHLDADAHPAQAGTGIGLALSRQLVELHGGQIELEAHPGPGACFLVRLPRGQAHIAPEHLLRDFQDGETFSAYLDKAARDPLPVGSFAPVAPGEPRGILLVVEDHAQVRDYVRDMFAPYYEVQTAADGREGLKLALASVPDLIISDVMMPGMDGISLCSQLKSRIETSHIPVILLTARTGQIFRVEGLETGADDYLTKPFSPYELQLKVRNLLETRRRIRERFHSVLKLEPQEITLTSADEVFLTRAIAIVEAHMDDPGFRVEDFADELAVSRPLLFTKLKALTNQTPNNFVKSLRLKRSAWLLSQSDRSVAEIAYQVGFGDARYFSKCFQKAFGCTPSAYREGGVD
ncbi:MAG: two-component regulator propeller domain-containing protein [Bacteroidia bacterium]